VKNSLDLDVGGLFGGTLLHSLTRFQTPALLNMAKKVHTQPRSDDKQVDKKQTDWLSMSDAAFVVEF
jgi:hypothetical protein